MEKSPRENKKKPRKLLDQVRDVMRLKHYALSTERTYTSWIKRFILFHDKKHPKNMGEPEVEAFLTWLAVEKTVSKSTQNQAFNALIFLYREVLNRPLEGRINAVRSSRKQRLSIVMCAKKGSNLLLPHLKKITKESRADLSPLPLWMRLDPGDIKLLYPTPVFRLSRLENLIQVLGP